ncbi:hypothetical protein GPECTOR_54g230 [Gonium pectorale]|uniref:Uncharacterized protein n=1 Tax=Gonium pectorale TaxID=33097 RepID=A0A150G6J8_GONPE|nr:hypothetical protein GPECTOR_54g230 [Gonium pectorale]|eukprot:KXZ45489.1 hypothetical protein GPECTOR_54g230 [Gonium pectorale]
MTAPERRVTIAAEDLPLPVVAPNAAPAAAAVTAAVTTTVESASRPSLFSSVRLRRLLSPIACASRVVKCSATYKLDGRVKFNFKVAEGNGK